MNRRIVLWVDPSAELSLAVQLLCAQCHQSARDVEWREGTVGNSMAAEDDEAAIELLCNAEGFQPGGMDEGSVALLGGAAWLCFGSSPEVVLGLCFGALRRSALERRVRAAVLQEDVRELAGELPALRHGAEVRR